MTQVDPRGFPGQPNEPFNWGKGGRRMTPQDIAREQEIAAGMMQGDYSPIQSPWQGLARVSGNVLGGLRARKANKAQDANASASQRIMEALMGGGDPASTAPAVSANADPSAPWAVPVDGQPMAVAGAPPNAPSSGAGGAQSAIMQAMIDPYLDPQVKAMAAQMYQRNQPVREKIGNDYIEIDPRTGASKVLYQGQPDDAFTQMMVNAGIDPRSPQGRGFYAKRVNAMADPEIVIPLANGTYVGPRSGMRDAVQGAPPAFAGWPDEEGGPASKAPDNFRTPYAP